MGRAAPTRAAVDHQDHGHDHRSGRPLSRIPAARRVAPHFVWREFWQGDLTEPPIALWPAYVSLATRYLEPLRQAFGPVTVFSGYRTPAHNGQVGGAPHSLHLGRVGAPPAVAADVGCRSGTPREWYQALDELHPGGLGLYATHVHVDNRTGLVARW